MLVADRWFTAKEAAAVRAETGAARRATFLRIWTRKEAYLKAIGAGMSRPLSTFAVSTGEEAALLWAEGDSAARWQLADLSLPGSAIGAAALPAGYRLRTVEY